MQSIADVFSSRAKTQIMEVLSQHPNGLPLRHVQALTDLAVRSVEIALDDLVQAGVIRRRRDDRKVLFLLDSHHPMTALLQQMFSLVMGFRLRARALTYQKSARGILTFNSQVRSLMKTAKK